MTGVSPPRLAETLLQWIVPRGVKGRSIVGDAREEYLEHVQTSSRLRARIWYWKHVLSMIPYGVSDRKRSTPPKRAWGVGVGNLLFDCNLAARSLLTRPTLTVAAVLTLGLGIGANVVIFSAVDAILLRPLPYPEPERLVSVFRIDPDVTGPKPQLSRLAGIYAVPPLVFRDWKALSPVFESAGAYHESSYTLTGGDRPERLRGAAVTSGVFDALSVESVLGRVILSEEDAVGAPSVVVLSDQLWHQRFGAEDDVLGRHITLNGAPRTIVGVMPPGFSFPDEATELWTNLEDRRKASPMRNAGFLQVIARLKPGVSLEQAQIEMDVVARQIGEAHPEEREHGIGLFPRKALIIAESRAGLLLLMAAVGLVLLIACANMANLLLVRSSERRRDLGVRQALGAGWQRLMILQFSESAALSFVGGATGCLIAVVGLRPFIALFPSGVPRVDEISLNYQLLGFAVGLSVLTSFLTGLLPAISAARAPVVDVLRDGGRGLAGGRRGSRSQAVLAIAEVALAFSLLAGAALFIRSLSSMTTIDPGFSAENRLIVHVSLPSHYRDSEQAMSSFFETLGERFTSIPGVTSVAHAGQMPFVTGWSFPPSSIETAEGVLEDSIHTTSVSPEYFSTMSIPVVAGRGFDSADRAGSAPVALINETMAQRYWPDGDPIGRRVKRNDVSEWSEWVTIVGVVGDTRYQITWEPFAAFYVPYAQRPLPYQSVIVESAVDPATLISSIRETLWELEPDMPAEIVTLEDRIRDSDALTNQRFKTFLLGSLSILAALLAIIGVYGVLSHSVSQRSREIGIRMAFGAGSRAVVRRVLGRGLLLTAIGLSIGVGLTLAASRVIQSLLFEVSSTDPVSLIGVALLVSAAAVVASIIPARRATRVDPVVTLRSE